jgi:hypothetical protein
VHGFEVSNPHSDVLDPDGVHAVDSRRRRAGSKAPHAPGHRIGAWPTSIGRFRASVAPGEPAWPGRRRP